MSSTVTRAGKRLGYLLLALMAAIGVMAVLNAGIVLSYGPRALMNPIVAGAVLVLAILAGVLVAKR